MNFLQISTKHNPLKLKYKILNMEIYLPRVFYSFYLHIHANIKIMCQKVQQLFYMYIEALLYESIHIFQPSS